MWLGRDAVVQMHDAVAEPALAQQFEVDPHVVRKRLCAAADDDRRDEQVAFIDQTGPDCLSGEMRAAYQRMPKSQLNGEDFISIVKCGS